MLSNYVTLLLMMLRIKVSLRAQRGNPLKTNVFFPYEIATLRSQ